MSDSELSKLEQLFLSPDKVTSDFEKNQAAQSVALDLGFAWKVMGVKSLTEMLNATAIFESTYESYKSSVQLIKASNQNYWASIALFGLSKLPELAIGIGQIIKLLYGTVVESPNEQKAQELLQRSLSLAEAAVQSPDFLPNEIQYIVSSYIRPKTAEPHKGIVYPLLGIFLIEMEEQQGLSETLDFFDKVLIDGPNDHPFSYHDFTLDTPYLIKRSYLFLNWISKYEDDSELSVRLAKTFANFSVRAFADKQYINRYPNPQAPWEDIRHSVYLVGNKLNISKSVLFNKLSELGFDERIVEAFRNNDIDGSRIGGLSSSTTLSTTSREYGQSRDVLSQVPEIQEALKIFGFPELPSKFQLTTRYRRLIREYHPDTSGHPNAADIAPRITRAYSILLDAVGK